MNTKKFDFNKIKDFLIKKLIFFKRYRIILTLILIAVTYGYVFWDITMFYNVQPTSDAISAQTTAIGASPHIDKTVVKQLEMLQDNNVSVKTLFNQTRSNPFQE